MLRIGLTGGMGAGKSAVARALAELGAMIIDSDVIAREVVAPGTDGLARLVAAFGEEILAADGSLDRGLLAERAFSSDAVRRQLNEITHPLVGQRTAELLATAGAETIVVQDIPLLVENGLGALMQLVVVVDAAVETRIARLREHRGISESDARSRIAAQATDEQRRAAADVWLDNNGSPAQTSAAVRELWENRLVPFEANVRGGRVARRQTVRLVASDPDWPRQANRLIDRLRVVCGPVAQRIDHIGSTAVPDLPAKDVIDIQITVADMSAADSVRETLGGAGFPVIAHITQDNPKPADADPATWEKRLHGNADPGRPAFIHLRRAGSPSERFALAFRDWLRGDSAARGEYLQVKREAAEKATGLSGEEASAAYTAAKEPWFDSAYQRLLG